MKFNEFVSTLTRGRKAFGQLCGALALAAAGMAQAAPVTYFFGGQLSWIDSNLSTAFAIGDGFSGSFTYESTTADSVPGDPNRGFYGPGPAFTVTINSLASGCEKVSHAHNGDISTTLTPHFLSFFS